MTDDARRYLRMAVSALTTGLMGAGTTVLGSVSEGGEVKAGTWTIAGVSLIIFICKDLQASLSQPPARLPLPKE